MFRKTEYKDAVRNIRRRFVSWLSIIVIACLAASAFLGIRLSALALRGNVNRFYEACAFRDLEIPGTLLLTEDDLSAIRQSGGVRTAEGIRLAESVLKADDAEENVTIISLTENINLPRILEGRLPENTSECLIEPDTADEFGLVPGDRITLPESEYLTNTAFTISGIAVHPDHIVLEAEVGGNRYIMTDPAVFAADAYDECFNTAEVLFENTVGVNRFSRSYFRKTAAYRDALEALGDERAPARYDAVRAKYLPDYEDAKAALDDAEQQLTDARDELDLNQERIVASEAALAGHEKEAAYDSWRQELSDLKKELAEKEAEYQDALAEYEDGKAELEEAAEALNDIPRSRWTFLNAKGSSCYIYTRSLSDNFSNISFTFSLLFVLVGALVIYATVSKIVDDQRRLIGTTKALGFFSKEIRRKYLLFGISASLIGCAAGIILSCFIIERLILNMQLVYFHIPGTSLITEPLPIVLSVLLAVFLSAAAVILASRRLLRESAFSLMKDAVPKGLSSDGKKRKVRGSLYSRLTFRNMRSDPVRVIVTIVAVAGSCALMVIGLSVRHAMSSAVDIQFNDIYRYDYILDFDSAQNSDVEKEVETLLGSVPSDFIKISCTSLPFMNGDDMETADLLVGDPGDLTEYTLFTKAGSGIASGEMLDLADGGIYVPQKLAETGGYVRTGSITVFDRVMKPYLARTSGAFSCYIARFFVMSKDGYRRLFGEEAVPNQYLIRISSTDAESITDAMLKIHGVRTFYPSLDRKANFESYVAISAAILVLLTVMSFVMAFFILLNLVNMFISQKKRELAVMRINGFTVRETKAYVGREIVLTTLGGILIGIPLGAVLAQRIIIILEGINCFDRALYLPGLLIAAVVTALFSLFVGLWALRTVRTLDLTDVN